MGPELNGQSSAGRCSALTLPQRVVPQNAAALNQVEALPHSSDRGAQAERGKQIRGLAGVARTRVGNAGLRAGSCAIVALIATSVLGNPIPLIWFAGFVIVLSIDRAVHAKLLKNCEANIAPRSMHALIAWTITQSAYGNLIAIMLWFAKYVHGETLAIIYIFGGLANAAATLRTSPALSMAGAGPTVAVLLALPLVDYFFLNGRNELDLLPLVGSLLFLAFGINLWRGLLASDAAQAQAEAAVLRERLATAAAAAAKSDTIQRMNDELRTPLAALTGAAEHLRRAAQSPEARLHIGALVQAGDVLRLVLDDLSDLDQLENGQVKIELKPADPRDIARGVVSAFRAAAADKGLELFLDIAPETPAQVEIDPLRVRQILFNLIANAVRYTTHGGVRVRLQVQKAATPGRIRLGFVVADTGMGMSRSQLALVFGRGRVGAEGPGLGLAISLRLARLMGAKLAGRSELGEGSVFSFVIEAPMLEASAGLRGQSAA
jgi:signal transduction histidine kinase